MERTSGWRELFFLICEIGLVIGWYPRQHGLVLVEISREQTRQMPLFRGLAYKKALGVHFNVVKALFGGSFLRFFATWRRPQVTPQRCEGKAIARQGFGGQGKGGRTGRPLGTGGGGWGV